ncbi:uncharacterized protein JCM15063_002056 [Sporobolomyces koalae]|uniref:uncharacterized protein n=1 Tax=Sporobolomyces koalae TaxID=500713 RepID=UPI0031729C61
MVLFYTSNVTGKDVTIYAVKDKFENEDSIKYATERDIWFHVDKLSSPRAYLPQIAKRHGLGINGAEVSHLAPALAAIQGASSLAAFDPRILSDSALRNLDPVALTAVFQELPDSAVPTAWDSSQLGKIQNINAVEDGSVVPPRMSLKGSARETARRNSVWSRYVLEMTDELRHFFDSE